MNEKKFKQWKNKTLDRVRVNGLVLSSDLGLDQSIVLYIDKIGGSHIRPVCDPQRKLARAQNRTTNSS